MTGIRDLIALKRKVERPKDIEDIAALEGIEQEVKKGG
jgi:hypothetical protein